MWTETELGMTIQTLFSKKKSGGLQSLNVSPMKETQFAFQARARYLATLSNAMQRIQPGNLYGKMKKKKGTPL